LEVDNIVDTANVFRPRVPGSLGDAETKKDRDEQFLVMSYGLAKWFVLKERIKGGPGWIGR